MKWLVSFESRYPFWVGSKANQRETEPSLGAPDFDTHPSWIIVWRCSRWFPYPREPGLHIQPPFSSKLGYGWCGWVGVGWVWVGVGGCGCGWVGVVVDVSGCGCAGGHRAWQSPAGRTAAPRPAAPGRGLRLRRLRRLRRAASEAAAPS